MSRLGGTSFRGISPSSMPHREGPRTQFKGEGMEPCALRRLRFSGLPSAGPATHRCFASGGTPACHPVANEGRPPRTDFRPPRVRPQGRVSRGAHTRGPVPRYTRFARTRDYRNWVPGNGFPGYPFDPPLSSPLAKGGLVWRFRFVRVLPGGGPFFAPLRKLTITHNFLVEMSYCTNVH